jgi:hypothetical protein
MLPAQLMNQLKGNQSPHTVAKECERYIQVGMDHGCQRLNEGRQSGERPFFLETLATGQSNTPQLSRPG